MPDAIRIFVGCPASNEDLECQAVLAHSVLLKASMPVEFTWMMLSRDPASFWYSDPQAMKGWKPHTWATPFSPFRWCIPEACGWQGKAIYMDSDQIAMADMAELWSQDMQGKPLLMSKDGASCVMLLDCAACNGKLPPREAHWRDPNLYRHVRGQAHQMAGVYKDEWNCRDLKNSVDGGIYRTVYDPQIKVFHYTAIPTQPNHKWARARLKGEKKEHWFPGPDVDHPSVEVRDLFDQMLSDAIDAGRGPETYRSPVEFGDYGRKRAA